METPVLPVQLVACDGPEKLELGFLKVGVMKDAVLILQNTSPTAQKFSVLQVLSGDEATVMERNSERLLGVGELWPLHVSVQGKTKGVLTAALQVQRGELCPLMQVPIVARFENETFFTYFDSNLGYAAVGAVKKRSVQFQTITNDSVHVLGARAQSGANFSVRILRPEILQPFPVDGVEVLFSPDSEREFYDEIVIETDSQAAPFIHLPVSGKGGGPILEMVSEIDFGMIGGQLSGSRYFAWRDVSIRNIGSRLPNDDGGLLTIALESVESGTEVDVTALSVRLSPDSGVALAPGEQSRMRIEVGSPMNGDVLMKLRFVSNAVNALSPLVVKGQVAVFPVQTTTVDRISVVFPRLQPGEVDRQQVQLGSRNFVSSLIANVRVENTFGSCFATPDSGTQSRFVNMTHPEIVHVFAVGPDAGEDCEGTLSWSQYDYNFPDVWIPISFNTQ